jgi:hypothetical protein
MLDAYIIEELKRQEERHRDLRRPVLEIPKDEPLDGLDQPDGGDDDGDDDDESDDRGVIIIDYST